MAVILFFILMAVLTVAICFWAGSRTAGHADNFLQRRPAVVKAVLFFYVAFAGCFTFPIRSDLFPLDSAKLYLLIASYGIIGLGFAGVYGPEKEKVIYPITLMLTILGILCRYLLEYGEISNYYNFTLFNIASYIVVMPIYTVLAYHYIVKYLMSGK
ncbi:hypothetical protein V3C10_05955 [[Clostridium] symbiosum]|uniref:hypothetical protein n=1 Tax=Clostridium symbiosum TaxID=1512 RepID=UPI001D0741EF|nr:hypothetical protein [[Clostridium] symbiosum]MCB6609524.1 hypothetical protein [[Clostridium] symbiosum]MCB6929483.1 hypothetical protein [[Clostridium] symbiosum]